MLRRCRLSLSDPLPGWLKSRESAALVQRQTRQKTTSCRCRCARNITNSVNAQRRMSTSPRKKSDRAGTGSIFSSTSLAQDYIFSNLGVDPPPNTGRPSQHRSIPRRQSMTASEFKSIEEMLMTVFEQVEPGARNAKKSTAKPSASHSSSEGGFLGRLVTHSRESIRTSQTDHLIEQKKEAIDLCTTDKELLQWAAVNVFDEVKQHLESTQEPNPQVSTTYQHIIPILIRTFRDRFRDPNLALSIFKCAQKSSIASYVYGCSTEAYNEVLKTLWSSLRDMQAVKSTLEEMSVNGVQPNPRTTKIVESLYSEATKQRLWLDDSEEGNTLAWVTLTQISNLLTEMLDKNSKPGTPKNQKWTDWKVQSSSPGGKEDEWAFDEWGDSENSKRSSKTFGLRE